MGSRLSLQGILESILGTSNVYFQPPESFKLTYPCIVYKMRNVNTEFADNIPYRHKKSYSITVIALDPDTDIYEKVLTLRGTTFERTFTSAGLNHYVINITF